MPSENSKFFELKDICGNTLALFYCCLIYNLPFLQEIVDKKADMTWQEYCSVLNSDEYRIEADDELSFFDGQTNIKEILKNSQDELSRQINEWGIGDEGNPYSSNDYKRLDELFKTYSSRLVSAGGYDAQQEDTLRVCSKMRLASDKYLAKGGKENIDIAAKLNKMIQDQLASENLRKKDEKPVEELRIDSIVDALEKGGLLENGKILPLPELQQALLERLGILGGKPSHKYPYTLDAADQMIHIIINTMRGNDGLPEMTEFLDNTKLDINVAPEFAALPNKEEQDAYEQMGLIRWGKNKGKRSQTGK